MTKTKASKRTAKKEAAPVEAGSVERPWRWAGQLKPEFEVVAKPLMEVALMTRVRAQHDPQWEAASRILAAVSGCVARQDLAPLESLATEATKLAGGLFDGPTATETKDAMLAIAQEWIDAGKPESLIDPVTDLVMNSDVVEGKVRDMAIEAARLLPDPKPAEVVAESFCMPTPAPEAVKIERAWRRVARGKKQDDPKAYVSAVLRGLGLSASQVKSRLDYVKKRTR